MQDIQKYMNKFIIFSILLIVAVDMQGSSPRYLELADSADMLIQKERWVEAETTILKALRLEPANFSNALLLSNLGLVRENLGKMDEAIEAFTLGLSLSPSSTVLYNNRARSYLLTGEYEKADKDITESLRIDSIQELPLTMKGYMEIKKNNLEDAKKVFLKLEKKFPDNKSYLNGLATIAETEGNFEEALRYYDKAIESDPENEELYPSRILLKIRMDKYSEASADIHQSIQKFPENPMFYLLRGYLHKLNYRNEEAEADRKIAISKGIDIQLVDEFIPIRR